jgi:hypothetical protein
MHELLNGTDIANLTKACIVRCLKQAGTFGTVKETHLALVDRLEFTCRIEKNKMSDLHL